MDSLILEIPDKTPSIDIRYPSYVDRPLIYAIIENKPDILPIGLRKISEKIKYSYQKYIF